MKKVLVPLLVVGSMVSSLNAVDVTLKEKIAGLYVAFFDRAPDESGLNYWINRGQTMSQEVVLNQEAALFATHPSFDRAYGDLDNRSFVEEVYKNTLGREGDEAGINYWTSRLNLPASDPNYLSRSDFVALFVDIALTFDRNDPQYANLSQEDLEQAQLRHDLLANKVEVALRFVNDLGSRTNVADNQNPEDDPAYKASIKILSGVTESHTTVDSVVSYLDGIMQINDPIEIINKNVQSTSFISLNRVDISLIGSVKDKYNENNLRAVHHDDVSSFIGEGSLDLSNIDTPIELISGKFYNVKVTLSTSKAYPEGVNFSFVLVKENNETVEGEKLFSKNVYSIRKEIDESGEFVFDVPVYIGNDLEEGKYSFNVYAQEDDLDILSVIQKRVSEVSQIGGLYVNVKQDEDSQKIEIIDLKTPLYVDLPYKDIFINGHTNRQAGKASFALANTHTEPKTVKISATMKLNGNDINLMLLDSNSGEIKNEIQYTIPVFREDEKSTGTYNIDITYYLPENQYSHIISMLPDMSKDESEDGVSSEIQWHIEDVNDSVSVDDNLLSAVELSKFENNFLVTENATSTQFTLHDFTHELFYSSDNYKWVQSAVFDRSIDAIIDYDDNIAYVFSDRTYAKYDKVKKELIGNWYDRDGTITLPGGLVITDPMWKGIPFDTIDATVKNGDIVYIFSGSKYVRYSISQNKVIEDEDEDGYETSAKISIINFATGMPFTHVDAAVNDYHGYIYLFNAGQYVKINMNTFCVEDGVQNVADKWGDVGTITAALSDSKGKNRVVFFDGKNAKTKFLNYGEYLFKYGSDYKQQFGNKSKAALSFDCAYGINGTWMIPGLHAYAYSKIDFDLLDHSFKILNFDSQADASVSKLHPLADENMLNNAKSLNGMRLLLEAMGTTYFNENNMTERTVTQVISDSAHITQDLDETKNTLNNISEIPLIQERWYESKDLFKTIVVVWIVPVNVTVGIEGSLNIDGKLKFRDIDMEVGLNTPFNLSTYATADVDVGAAKVGVEGDVDVVNGGLNASIIAGLRVDEEYNLVYGLEENVDFTLNVIQAAFSVYAKVWGKVEWCEECVKFLGCASVPCGVGYYEYDEEVYRTPWLFNRIWNLLHEKQDLIKLPIE